MIIFHEQRAPKGIGRMLRVVEDFLDKFRGEKNNSEVKQQILDKHCDFLEKMCDNEDIAYSDARKLARSIVAEHFEKERHY